MEKKNSVIDQMVLDSDARETSAQDADPDYYGCHPETFSARELEDIEDAERVQDRFLARMEEYDEDEEVD